MVIQFESQLVTNLAENEQLYHVTLSWEEIGRHTYTSAFLSTKNTYFQSRELLFNTIDLDNTRQSHVVFIFRLVWNPMGIATSNNEIRN